MFAVESQIEVAYSPRDRREVGSIVMAGQSINMMSNTGKYIKKTNDLLPGLKARGFHA